MRDFKDKRCREHTISSINAKEKERVDWYRLPQKSLWKKYCSSPTSLLPPPCPLSIYRTVSQQFMEGPSGDLTVSLGPSSFPGETAHQALTLCLPHALCTGTSCSSLRPVCARGSRGNHARVEQHSSVGQPQASCTRSCGENGAELCPEFLFPHLPVPGPESGALRAPENHTA